MELCADGDGLVVDRLPNVCRDDHASHTNTHRRPFGSLLGFWFAVVSYHPSQQQHRHLRSQASTLARHTASPHTAHHHTTYGPFRLPPIYSTTMTTLTGDPFPCLDLHENISHIIQLIYTSFSCVSGTFGSRGVFICG